MARRAVVVVVALAVMQGLAVLAFRRFDRGEDERSSSVSFPFERWAVPGAVPDITFVDSAGGRSRLSQHRGRPVLLHLWATWCQPCRTELPGLLRLGDSVAPGFELLAVSVDDEWSALEKFFGGIPPSTVRRALDDQYKALGVRLLPSTFVILGDGTPAYRVHGARDWTSPEALRFVNGLAGSRD